MPEPLAFSPHDHSACIQSAFSAAEAHCAKEGLRLTPVRRASLEFLLRAHRAIGAYELLDHLAAEGHGAQPPVAYRALAFLTGAGFAHKIEALNAYIACAHLGTDHTPAFLVCTSCRAVAEADAVATGLSQAADQAGFAIGRTVIEATGLCPQCR